MPKNLHHLPFIKTTSKWGKKGHGSLHRGAKKGGRRRGEDRRRGPRPPLPSRIAIQATRAGTEPHVRGRRMKDGALNRAGGGHRPPSAVRSRVRPTPSRGASPKICSLEPPPPTPHPHAGARPLAPRLATRPTATSGGNRGNKQPFTHPVATPARSRKEKIPRTSDRHNHQSRCSRGSSSSPSRQRRDGRDCGGGSDCSVAAARPLDVAGAAAALDKSGWARKHYFI